MTCLEILFAFFAIWGVPAMLFGFWVYGMSAVWEYKLSKKQHALMMVICLPCTIIYFVMLKPIELFWHCLGDKERQK